jgi:hypothetical protein
MKMKTWRTGMVSVLSVAVLNTGMLNVAQAGIVDTGAMIQTARDANLLVVQTQLARDDVRAQLTRFGVDAAEVDARLATLTDQELATLSQRMQQTPAGGDGLLAIIGLTFVVLIILEWVGIIDIFKRNR